jgi:hypothetical protein
MSRPKEKGRVTPALQTRTEALLKKNVGKVWSKEIVRKVVKVTPVHAAHLLEKNTRNREVSQGTVDKYARDMKAGRWKLNGETIKFDWNGELRDGQHRLWAVLQADEPVDLEFAENLDPAVMDTIDTGRARSFGDVLRIGGAAYSKELAAVLRWQYMYDRKSISTKGGVSHSELKEVAEKYTDLESLIPEALKYTRARRMLGPGIWCFVFASMCRIGIARAIEFAEQLDSGENLTKGMPALTLRERMMANITAKAKISRIMVCAMAIKAANAHLHAKSLTVLKWQEGEGFPEFVKYVKAK